MDTQTLINVGFGIAGFFGGWILNNISSSIIKIEDKMANMPEKYVNKEDYRRDIDKILHKLDQIFEKLDAKADKP
jgi:hypothetical protein